MPSLADGKPDPEPTTEHRFIAIESMKLLAFLKFCACLPRKALTNFFAFLHQSLTIDGLEIDNTSNEDD
jgi:hypothetical protein